MSFQGDVAGLGLGELLQGLGRGGRDGVLTLYGDSISASLGLKGGQLYLLEGPDERETVWRERCHQAWCKDPQPALESQRRDSIARAARMETLYRMLDAPNLHFRFEPGPLPLPAGHTVKTPGAIALDVLDRQIEVEGNPWGQGMTVEFVLLEQARIADEAQSGPAAHLQGFDVPRAIDAATHQSTTRDFLEECDGTSTLLEISDRLGQPLSQIRATVGAHLAQGSLRMAQPRELLACAQRELELAQPGRAAARVTGWVRTAPPGPPTVEDADLLVSEWERGRLPHLLGALGARTARILLRKLDHVHLDTRAAQTRWRTLFEAHRGNDLISLHEVALRLTITNDPDARTFHDLLKLARSFQERGYEQRTRTLLRLAASHLPSKPQTRIELGKRMIETGLVEEGTRWLLDTARELLDMGDGERSIIPIRSILKYQPDNNEANGLLLQTRSLMAKKKRRRWNTMAGLSAGLILSLVALVKFRSYREIENELDEIRSHISQPEVALKLLDEKFPNDQSERIGDLRSRILALKKQNEDDEHSAWLEKFTAVEEECRFGDPLMGLKRTLSLTPPPSRVMTSASWPERQDLLGTLASRLTLRSRELDVPADASMEDLHIESRFADMLEELIRHIDPNEAPDEATSFRYRVEELLAEVTKRSDERMVERVQIQQRNMQKDTNILLATARAHEQAGDLARSLDAYDRLVEMDPELGQLAELEAEIREVRAHWQAVEHATSLAKAGRHDEAAEALKNACPRPVEHLLPWQVDSRPSGARVSMPDGSVRTTPFVAYSGVGERVELNFEFEGCAERSLTLIQPRNVAIHLHRHAERRWESRHRIEAAPVAAGNDHVVADRSGRVARLGPDATVAWEVQLKTLGGIASTPVFLPGKPGHLLVISEDGLAWILNGSTGEALGPRDIGSPLIDGPTLTRGGVSARFEDDRVAVWKDELEPKFYTANGFASQPANATASDPDSSATMAVLRRGMQKAESLTSPWTGWTVHIGESEFLVLGPDGKGFTVERRDQWTLVAWEAPKAMLGAGRLWVSDATGIRSFVPEGGAVVTY